MNKLTKSNKIFIVPIVVIIIFGLIIMPAIMPIIKSEPKDIPIGLLVEDEGEIGENLAKQLPNNAPNAIQLKTYQTEAELNEAMDKKEVYGALAFPDDFSKKIESLMTDSPEQASVTIYVNEGANMMAANMVETALPNIVQAVNAQVSSQMIAKMSEQVKTIEEQLEPVLETEEEGSPLADLSEVISPVQPDEVQELANPVHHEVVKVHEAGKLGNSPTAFITVTWIGSIFGAVILYLAGRNRHFETKTAEWKFNTSQSVLPFVYGIFGGYIVTWYSTWILGFTFESFHLVALYIGLAITTFILLIFATLRWLGLPSIAIYAIMMFFSMATIQLPREMMPPFHKDYLYSWLPLRIFGDGLREVLFFSQSFINEYSIVLIWILVISLFILWLKNVLEKVRAE